MHIWDFCGGDVLICVEATRPTRVQPASALLLACVWPLTLGMHQFLYSVGMSVQLCLLYWLHARWYVLDLTPGRTWRICAMDRQCSASLCTTPRLRPLYSLRPLPWWVLQAGASTGTPGSFSRVSFFGFWVVILVVLSGDCKMRLSFADGSATTDHLEGQTVQHLAVITHKQLAMVCGALMQMIVVLVVLALPMVVKCAFLVAVGATWETGVAVSYNLVFYQALCTVPDLAMTLQLTTCVMRGTTVRSRATRRPRSRANTCACMYYVCLCNGFAARLSKHHVATRGRCAARRVQVGRDTVVCARNSANHERAV